MTKKELIEALAEFSDNTVITAHCAELPYKLVSVSSKKLKIAGTNGKILTPTVAVLNLE